jgi:hypothetical protein
MSLAKARVFFASIVSTPWSPGSGEAPLTSPAGLRVEAGVLRWLRLGAEVASGTVSYDYEMPVLPGIPNVSQSEYVQTMSFLASSTLIPLSWAVAPYLRLAVGASSGSQYSYGFTRSMENSFVVARGDLEIGALFLQSRLFQGTLHLRATVIQPFPILTRQFDFWGTPREEAVDVLVWSVGLGFSIGVGL